jgi:hypothetical protein
MNPDPEIEPRIARRARIGLSPERKIETTKDTKVHENQRVENLSALIFEVWMGLPSRG